MATPNVRVEQAFIRNAILLKIIDLARQRAQSDGSNKFALSLGIIDDGDKSADAERKIDHMFAQLKGLAAHLAILDIAASFEIGFRDRLRNAIGEARKAVKENYNQKALRKVCKQLIRDVEDYRGLGGIEKLLGPQLDQAILDNLKNIRDIRNNFAHGTDVEIPPTVDSAVARHVLLTVAQLL